LSDDLRLAIHVATQAGDRLLALRSGVAGRTGGAWGGGTDTADESTDRLIGSILAAERPDDAILSEEVASAGDRTTADRVWIIDPLDGTREYGEPGRSDWAVHVALWERRSGADGDLTEGVVALPAAGEVWSTDSAPADPVSRMIKRIAVSRTRPPAWALAVADELGAVLVPLGSAGAKTAAVLRGDVDAYLHDGGQYEWDSAAPVVVAQHHGFHASRADGSPLVYNQPDVYLPDLVVCPAAQAEDLLARIARHRRNPAQTPTPTDDGTHL
jgi:3'(2'), 5'-bisphosphate nucleotidase